MELPKGAMADGAGVFLAAKIVFSLAALVGGWSVGGAALYVAAYTPGEAWLAFLAIFVPCAALWVALCFWAYKGLTSDKAILIVVFWLFVVANVFVFPVGTVIAAVSIWLWRDSRKQTVRPLSSQV